MKSHEFSSEGLDLDVAVHLKGKDCIDLGNLRRDLSLFP